MTTPVEQAAERRRRWLAANSLQERYDIYQDHPRCDRIGGRLMEAHWQDLERLADAYLAHLERDGRIRERCEAKLGPDGDGCLCPGCDLARAILAELDRKE